MYAYTKPCEANIWTSNLGLQNLNENQYFIVENNITSTMHYDHEKSIDVRITKNKKSKLQSKNYNKVMRVNLEKNQVNNYIFQY